MLTTQTANVHIRWMTRAELPYVLDIERRSFPAHAWGEEAFLSELRKRTVIGMAAVREERVLGYVIYELHGDRMDVLNFAVHPFYRGQGVGSQMIGKLKAKLHSHRRGAIRLDAREQSLQMPAVVDTLSGVISPADVFAADPTPGAEQVVSDREDRAQIAAALAALPPKWRFIVERRFGLGKREPMSLAEIGEAMGVCKERVRQIDRQAIARLAAMLAGVRGC